MKYTKREQERIIFTNAQQQLIKLKEQNKKMHQALKQVQSDINIAGEISQETREKIKSILKEIS